MRRHLGASLIRSTRPADPAAGRSATDLLARFAESRDEQAFAELVRRYGRMVLAVCRRGAGHPQDAEDAFQAVFLVLARKADRVGRPDALGNWLYGVAVRVAGRARRAATRRARREVTAAVLPDRGADPPQPWADVRAAVERELAALPERFRRAVELCDLSGLSRAEAAEAMGVPEGTVSSRLTTGRGLLAARLTKRGVTLGAGLAVVPAADAARLVGPTVGRVVDGLAGEHVRALARWGGSDMGVWVRWAGAVAAAGLTVGLVTAWGGRPPDDPPKPPAAKEPPKEVAKGVEPAAKAPAPGRPRMTERVEIPWGDQIAGWSADGNWLAVAGENGVTFYDAHELTPRGGLETGKSPTVLGFLADEPVLVTYKAGAGRINREEVLQFWPPAKRLDGTIRPAPFGRTRLHDVGRPIALLDGGKAVLTVDTVYRRDPAAPPGSHPTVAGHVWRVVDAATGEVVREAARSEPLRHFVQAPSPDGKALAVLAMGPEAVRLENWDLTTGKRRWAKDLISLAGGRADTVYLSPPVFSPDGATLAVEVPRPLKPAADAGRPEGDARPEPVYDGSELRLFAAADGTERGRPAEQAAHRNTPFQFSHDGRLLRGRRAGLRDESLSIWDARGGRLVKGWDTFATAAFAPDRPVLAILEDTWYQDGNNRVKQAVLALWDVSDLVK